ncbi:hypothetical protein BDF22DRAFT_745960 [Syncephalis plumigaleata]|nr:hypothetical protein BDF22DRAFT_745960 [Syncephalis plumigaleata]
MKFSAVIVIAVVIVAVASLVAVEAKPILERRAPQDDDGFADAQEQPAGAAQQLHSGLLPSAGPVFEKEFLRLPGGELRRPSYAGAGSSVEIELRRLPEGEEGGAIGYPIF